MPGPHEHLDHPERVIAEAFAGGRELHRDMVVQTSPLDLADVACKALRDAGLVVLADQPDHFLNVDGDGWFIEHSIACRVAGTIGTCDVNQAVRRVADDLEHGRWKVTEISEGLPTLERTG